MLPVDTLLIDGGYYYEPIHPIVEGIPGKYITIKALNDGKATIDGRGVVSPVKLGDVWPGPMESRVQAEIGISVTQFASKYVK